MWKKAAKLLLGLFWPEIKKLLAKYVRAVLDWFEIWIRDIFTRRNDSNAHEAESRADEADKAAAQATDPSETEKWKAVSSVWREVAEMHRRENELLQSQLAEAKRLAEERTEVNLKLLTVDDAFDMSDDEIRATTKPLQLDKKL